MPDPRAKIVITAENKAGRVLRQTETQLTSVANKAARTAASIAGIGVGIVLTKAVKEAASLERALSSVAAVTGATADQMAALEASARSLGATTSFSATEAAQGLKFLGQAGFTAEQSIAALPGTINLAIAGSLELGRAADIASNVLSGFGLSADETTRVVDVLAKAASSANTDVEQLGEAFKLVAPVADALDISLEETAAAIGILSNAGIQATSAGTGLRGILSALIGPTGAAKDAIESLGLSTDDLSPKTKTLTEILEILSKSGLDAERALAIFGKQQVSAALALTKSADAANGAESAIRALAGEMDNAGGSAQNMADIMGDNLTGDISRLNSAFSELSIILVSDSGFGGAIRSTVQNLTSLISATGDAVKAIRGFFDVSKESKNLDAVNARLASLRSSLRRAESGEGIADFLGINSLAEGSRKRIAELKKEIQEFETIRDRLIGQANQAEIEARFTPVITTEAPDQGERTIARLPRRSISRVTIDPLKNLKLEADRLAESLRTPEEAFAASIQSFNELSELAGLSTSTFNRAVVQAVEDLSAAYDDFTPQAAFERTIEQLNTLRGQELLSIEAYTASVIAAQDQFEAATANAERGLREFAKDLTLAHNPAEQLENDLRKIDEAFAKGLISAQVWSEATFDALEGVEDAAKDTDDAISSIGEETFAKINSALEDALVNFDSLRDIVSGLEQDLLRLGIRELVTEPLAEAAKGFFKQQGAGGSGGGIFGSLLSFLPGFASGGSFNVGPQTSAAIPGIDNRVVAFRARDGEKVEVTPRGQQKQGNQYVFNIALPSDDTRHRRSAQQLSREIARTLSSGSF